VVPKTHDKHGYLNSSAVELKHKLKEVGNRGCLSLVKPLYFIWFFQSGWTYIQEGLYRSREFKVNKHISIGSGIDERSDLNA
jgi:hypothetical protein